MQTDAGEVSEDEEEQDETVVMNGDCKLERQNSKQGSLRRQIVKVNLTVRSLIHFLAYSTGVFLMLSSIKTSSDNIVHEPVT